MVASVLPLSAAGCVASRRPAASVRPSRTVHAGPALSIGAGIGYLFGMTPQVSSDTGGSDSPLPWPAVDGPAADDGPDFASAPLEHDQAPATADAPAADLRQSPADQAELAELMQRVARQDEAALAALYDRTVGRVLAAAIRITRNRNVAEEVTEDCFWQVWRDAPRYSSDRGQVVTWLLAITRSRAIDALRRIERRALHERPVDGDFLETLVDAGAIDGGTADDSRQRARLNLALDALDPLARQLLTLAFFHGLSHAEVAEHTGMPLGTVKSNIRRALHALKHRLQDHAGGPSDAP